MKESHWNDGEITISGFLNMQVCVPADWTDAMVIEFANTFNPSGVANGWQIEKKGHPALQGDPERNECEKYPGKVHIMLIC